MKLPTSLTPSAILLYWPGIAISGVIALAATFISSSYGGPQLLYALFFGLSFHFLSQHERCKLGIEFCSKTLLRAGVALLGVRITLPQIASLGTATLLLMIIAVISTILVGVLLARYLKRPNFEGILSGGAVGICGASAALAMAAVLPQTKENERFTLLTVVGVTTLSTVAMIVYPIIVKFSGIDAEEAGIFIGGTIHDVAQVVGAGYLISNHTGDVATIVKLTRVACLVPVVLVLSFMFQSRSGETEFDVPPLIPYFLVGFAFMVLMNTYGLFSTPVINIINGTSRSFLVIAIAALGIKTSFQSLAALGWKPVAMLIVETVWIAAFVMLGVLFV
jgi:uncharacterized integral membrane protein (TIGR00698 family)